LNSVLFPLIIELRELISLPSVTVVQDRLDNNERFNTMNRSRISTIITLKIDIIIIKREGGFYDYQHVFSTMPKRQKTTQKSSNAAKKSKPLTTKDGHEGEACKDVDTSPVLKGTPGSNPDNHNQEPAPRYWLMKSEPESRIVNGTDVKFGIDDLLACEGCTACWDGVRNYQARNFMKDMRLGDKAFFYHSNCKDPGIAGLVEIVKGAYIDHTQFDKKDPHYDPKSTKADPKWFMVSFT
jgi:predicted RNA-binding protein with PUA-like domain